MNKRIGFNFVLLAFFTVLTSCTAPNKSNQADNHKPVNPNATKEAKELLSFIYNIQGKQVLTGQHNYLGKMSVFTDSIYLLTGKYPAIWGCDYGFSDSTHDIDNIKYRPLLVPEIVKQHGRGSIITLTYHQASPLVGEPCQFVGGVQTKLTDEKWKELLTDGTQINTIWKTYMDRLAAELKVLQGKNIPVLFRPYHEMNGKWFWWGGHGGEEGFPALWKMLYHYYTNHHQLNNLIWVWSPDKPWHGLKEYYPGDDFVDIVSMDIYPEKDTNVVFRQEWYNEIKTLAGSRPFAIGECSKMPGLKEMEAQPGYGWFMLWSDLGYKSNSIEELIEVFNSDKCLTADELLNLKK
ncbi:MAG: glycoside hydrolase family 26 protein [Salinivirgaceae bacterium]|nr:glycoside hydrolase family 26 protein [Salinivirgaceae bacterium]